MDADIAPLIEKAAEALKAAGAREEYIFASPRTGKLRPGPDVDLAVSGLPPEVFFRAMEKAGRAVGRQVDPVDLDEDSHGH